MHDGPVLADPQNWAFEQSEGFVAAAAAAGAAAEAADAGVDVSSAAAALCEPDSHYLETTPVVSVSTLFVCTDIASCAVSFWKSIVQTGFTIITCCCGCAFWSVAAVCCRLAYCCCCCHVLSESLP